MKADRDRSIERLLQRAMESPKRPGPDCLDAETLAAFVDAGLSAAERRAAEAHIADCHRCQAVTAAIVKEPLVRSADLPARETRSWWKTRPALNWLIPAMAGATAIALWIAVPGQRGAVPKEAERQNQTVAARSEPPATVPPQPVPAPVEPSQKATSPAREDTRARVEAEEAASGPRSSADAAPPAAAGAAESDGRLVGRQEAGLDQLGDTAAAPGSPPAEASASLSAARAASAPIAAAFEVTSSDPRYRWRIGPGSTVQHSDDGGANWTTQGTGAPGPWTAGSSPSPQVCWLVGPQGTVLRSSDGGRQWQPTSPPEMGTDLVGVSATNALTATVTLADGRRLNTSDGGSTWTPVVN